MSVFFGSANDASRNFHNRDQKRLLQVSSFQPDGILGVSLERLDLGPRQNVLKPYFRDSAMVLQDGHFGQWEAGHRDTRHPQLRDRAETISVRLGPGDGIVHKVFQDSSGFRPQLVEFHLEKWLWSLGEQCCIRNRSSRGMALHTAITMVDRHNMAVGGGAATAPEQCQQSVTGWLSF